MTQTHQITLLLPADYFDGLRQDQHVVLAKKFAYAALVPVFSKYGEDEIPKFSIPEIVLNPPQITIDLEVIEAIPVEEVTLLLVSSAQAVTRKVRELGIGILDVILNRSNLRTGI
jgi:hypothetical protein